MRVFVAGAAGVMGQRLVPLLTEAGHEVTGSTRSAGRADAIRRLGATPVIADGLDAEGVGGAVGQAQPEVIIHQMTALSSMRNFRRFDREFAATNRLRTAGTDNLLAAARAAGTGRFIAQSYTGWPNIREGGPVKTEEDQLDPHPPAAMAESLRAIRHVERAVSAFPGGVVLRYGGFYGPGASESLLGPVRKRQMPVIGGGTGIWSFCQIEDAAAATVAAVTRGAPGIYNIVDDEPAPVAEWLPFLARCLGAKPPLRVPAWLGRLLAGEAVVSLMTQTRGSSNEKAKRELGWSPRYASWRDGFPAWTGTSPAPRAVRDNAA
ncbi:MAG: NAD(P)-dependent oxidoreductase [Streptosporangiaceae bacterium]|nr:NAD(P)-dependent oxidoreductase [Streptosporangiaceae bacterium]